MSQAKVLSEKEVRKVLLDIARKQGMVGAPAVSERDIQRVVRLDRALQQAKDANVRQRLLDLVGPRGTKKAHGPTYGISGDEWAALAVAVTAGATGEGV